MKNASSIGRLPIVPAYTINASDITKTSLYNFDPLKPHFYLVKLGFTGVYIIFLISAQKHNEYPQSMFLSRNMKNIRVFNWKFSVFGGEFFCIIVLACFRNEMKDFDEQCIFLHIWWKSDEK